MIASGAPPLNPALNYAPRRSPAVALSASVVMAVMASFIGLLLPGTAERGPHRAAI